MPDPDLKTIIRDFTVSTSMSGLNLKDHPTPESGMKPDNTVPIGAGLHSDSQTSSAHPQMSSTPVRPQMEPQNTTAVSATASSENLCSTVYAAYDSTTSVIRYDSASTVFHRDTSSNAPPVRQTSQGTSESVKESEMVQDFTREQDTDMDTIRQNEYKMHDSSQPDTQPDQQNQASTGAAQTAQLVAQLLKAEQEGTLKDVTDSLRGTQADELAKLKLLVQMVSKTAEQEWPNRPPAADTGTDSNSDSPASSGEETGGGTSAASSPGGTLTTEQNRSAPSRFTDLLHQTDSDVVLESEQAGQDLPGRFIPAIWEECVEREEANWPVHFPPSTRFIKPRNENPMMVGTKERTVLIHQGLHPQPKRQFCLSPDGSLALKQDAALPGASRGRLKYKSHDLK